MKKIFVAVLAMAGVVACNTVDTLDVPQNPEIRFANAFVENATRANEALDPSTTTNTLTGFNVWGFMDQTDGTVFVAEDVTGSKGNFSYANIQYWAPGHTYYFAALAPIDSANVKDFAAEVAGATEEEKFVKTVFNFKNVEGTEDLLYAAAKEVAPAMGASKTVMLTFDHLLSKVKFSFTNGFTNPNAYIDVKNVTMAVPATATATLTKDAYTWANQAGELILEFGDACDKTAINVKQEAANELLTIPAAQDYKIEFDVVYYQGSVPAYEGHKVVTLKNVAFEVGKAYNLAATLNASNITEDGTELQPIVFDVEEVKNWVEATTPDSQIEEAEFRAAAQLGGVVTLNKDVVLSSTLALANDLVLDLNGHNITINNDSDELGEGDGIIVTEGTLTIKGEGTVTANTRAIWARGNGGAVINIEGGHYVGATKGYTCEVIYASGNGVINIYGGTFEAETEDNVSFAAPQYAVLNLHGNGATGCNITVYGGSFKNFNPADNISENPKKNFCAEGYVSVANGEWFDVIKGAIASDVNTLTSALNNEDIVIVETAIDNGSNVINIQNNDVILNMNGNEITAGGQGTNNYAFNVYGSTVVVNDANIDGAGFAVLNSSNVTVNSGAIAAKPGKSGRNMFYVAGNSTVTVNEGTYTFDRTSSYFVYVEAGSTCYINGGHFEKPLANNATKDSFVNNASKGTVIITGGTFNVDPTKWLADGYKAVKSGKIWTVSAE